MAYAKIAVFVTQKEYNANGYSAQNLVTDELRERLDNTDLGYNVIGATDTPDMSTQDAGCGDAGLLNSWDNLVENCYVNPCSADSHLLISNATAIEGCAEVPGNTCVMSGGPHLASANGLSRYGPQTNPYKTFNGCAQEIFHNFNVYHKHGDNNYNNYSYGWYVSPMLTTYKNRYCGERNNCNDPIACDNPDGYDTQWTECAENRAESYLS